MQSENNNINMENNVSIVIIAYNEEKYLPVLLDSLLAQSNKQFEVVVVDSNSTDKTGEITIQYKKQFKELKYLKLEQAKGPAYARNQGVEIASFERLIFLDADTLLKSDFIEKVVLDLNKRQIDVATCPIRIAGNKLKSNFGAVFLNVFMICLRPFYSSAYGACFISTKTVHKQINGFREDLGVCEDCNYVKRARRKHHFKFRILSPFFYTSDRRAKSEGEFGFFFKYIKIHVYRMFTGKEIMVGEIKYDYGDF